MTDTHKPNDTDTIKPDNNEIDQITGTETTGHEWDGIKELNTPLPRWWLWTFYATIVFSIGYMIYYPSIPLLNASTSGISGQTNRLQLQRNMEAAELSRRDTLALLTETELASVRENEELYRFATAGGESIFKVYCSQCHGTGAAGGPGYPNLNDDDWIWGGDIESIYYSIAHGIRNDEDPQARFSLMPSFGADGILDRNQIAQVTDYVLQLSNKEHDAELAALGAPIYQANCSACHGDKGLGDRSLGAPNLADAISLYGATRETIRAQIYQPKHGVMPPWQDRIREANIRQLALYVHSLGGGEDTPSQ
jgi:cytochrome c oxidase cbb3-type subunit 3